MNNVTNVKISRHLVTLIAPKSFNVEGLLIASWFSVSAD
jgi:hypothetical protein